MPRVADDLAVLMLRDNGGWRCTGADAADVLAGALIAELVAEGFLDRQADPDDFWSRQRVHAQSVEPPTDPILARVWDLVTGGKGAQAVQRQVAKESRTLVMDALARREVVSTTPRPVLGPRHTLLDIDHRDRLRAELTPIVVEQREPDERQRTIIQLLNGAVILRQALGLSFSEGLAVQRGARQLGKPVWPEKTAIDLMVGRRAAVLSS